MDSVIMTSPENGTRLRSRLRSAANTICARSSKRTSNRNVNGNHHHHHHHHHNHKNGRNGTLSRTNSIHRSNSIHKHVNNCNRNNVNSTVAYVDGQDIVNKNDIDDGYNCHHDGLNTTDGFINGRNARQVYNAWCGRLGPAAAHIPAESVQALFNDMHLFPSKAQVYEMLQCARMYSNTGRRGTLSGSGHLTFGEFCVFANELKQAPKVKLHQKHSGQGYPQPPVINNRTNSNKPLPTYEVFLGGSCNPTTWRADIAIPTFKRLGISYYNPQVSTWSPDLLAVEHEAKQIANVLLFVLDSDTRCVAGMVEVAQLTAAQRCLVVVALTYKPHQLITNETISNQEFLDLWHGQNTLLALVQHENTPIFTNIMPALDCTANLLRNPTLEHDCVGEFRLAEKLTRLREAFDRADTNHMGKLTLHEVHDAYYDVTGSNLRLNDLKAIVQNNDNTNIDNVRISFEQFCGIVAEFSTNSGCDSPLSETRIDGWASNQPLQRQCSANNNTNNCDSTDNHISCSIKNGAITQNYTDTFNKTISDFKDIYLGGSCLNTTSWRDNIAKPMLDQHGLSYFYPSIHEKDVSSISNRNNSIQNISRSMSSSSEEDLDDMSIDDDTDDVFLENVKNSFDIESDVVSDIRKMERSRILLFVITNETRSIAPMLLAAHCIGQQKKNIVLCVQQLDTELCIIANEQLSKYAIKDYNRSRAYLSDMAKREGVPVFESIEDAVQCAINKSLQRR